MKNDLDIAQRASLLPIVPLARDRLGIPEDQLDSYGRYKAKVSLPFLAGLAGRPDGKLVLVSGISPTPAGEGKTTTAVGLADGLNRIGHSAIICLREPSIGPVFGMKGGEEGRGVVAQQSRPRGQRSRRAAGGDRPRFHLRTGAEIVASGGSARRERCDRRDLSGG